MKIIISNIPEAARLILAILRDPETGIKKKSLFEQNVGLFETFLESVPTTLILAYMWDSAFDGSSQQIIMINKFNLKY